MNKKIKLVRSGLKFYIYKHKVRQFDFYQTKKLILQLFITFILCFVSEIQNDNVYIVQTIKMNKLTQEDMKAYKQQVKMITDLNEANELECY